MSMRDDGDRVGMLTTEGWPASQPLLWRYYQRGVLTIAEYNTAVADIRQNRIRPTI